MEEQPELSQGVIPADDPINVGEVGNDDERPDVFGSTLFILIHVGCLLAFAVDFSWIALAVCLAAYVLRMFGITAGFHRYFAHRTYKTSRWFQFVMAWLGTSSAQQGPLWWAAHHRHHHRHSDTKQDIHSPVHRGFWWAHVGWVICKKYEKTETKAIPDFARYPELRFLNNFHMIPPIVLAVFMYALGAVLGRFAPSLGTFGWQMFIWGFCVSTVALYHATFCINSLAHVWGWKRFVTKDESRNNFWLALVTLGEGWHNNHHKCPYSERQGLYWWEVDFSHYGLKLLSVFRLVWDLQTQPVAVYEEAQRRS